MELVRYEAARRALAEAVAFDEVMTIKDVARQAEVYARQAKDNELIERATEIRVRAERKAGEMLTKAAQQGQRATRGNPELQRSHAATIATAGKSDTASHLPTLSEIGITKSESSRYQQLAAMPDEHFETAVATAKATAGEVTTAFMLREAKKTAPAPKKLTKTDQRRLQELKEAQARGVSMFSTYARLTLTALRAQTDFTSEERELLAELSAALREVSEIKR